MGALRPLLISSNSPSPSAGDPAWLEVLAGLGEGFLDLDLDVMPLQVLVSIRPATLHPGTRFSRLSGNALFEAFQMDGRIFGKTSSGHATVIALQLSNFIAVMVRREWVSAGWHPPE